MVLMIEELSSCSGDTTEGEDHECDIRYASKSYSFFMQRFPAEAEYNRRYRPVEIDGPNVPSYTKPFYFGCQQMIEIQEWEHVKKYLGAKSNTDALRVLIRRVAQESGVSA